MYDKDLLTRLLKSKIAKTKSKDEIIDELLMGLSKQNAKSLKAALDELFLMIYDNYDNANLKILVENKINALEISVPNINFETIYESLASSAGAKFAFDEIDIKSLETMRKNFYWMKNDYNEKISNDLKAITAKVFNGEITRANMAETLKEKFKGVLSANTSYFEGVSDHIISQAQNIARVNQSSKYGVKHYKVLARIDSRTSDICRSMNGRIIPASHIEAQSNNIQNAKDINEKKAAAIWRNEPFLGKILPSNFGLPPYHFRCRTELVPVWINEEEIDGVKMKNTSPLSKDEV
ncbi:structural protein, partial [Campylobacter fetus]